MLRLDEVRRRVGLSRTTIWRLERQGLFVPRRRLSPNAVGWVEEEVEEWIRSGAMVEFDRGMRVGGSSGSRKAFARDE
jgi:predicted DNA-binding transcriptional regulator AlpA